MNDHVQWQILTYWTDSTWQHIPNVFICSWSTGGHLTESVCWLDQAGDYSPSTQQRWIITAMAGSLSYPWRPTRRTGERLWHPTIWTVTSYGRQTTFFSLSCDLFHLQIYFKSTRISSAALKANWLLYVYLLSLQYLLDTADTGQYTQWSRSRGGSLYM